MKAPLALLTTAVCLSAQPISLRSAGVFDLGADFDWNRMGSILQSVLAPTVSGLTYGVITRAPGSETEGAFVSVDENGAIAKSIAHLFYLHAEPSALLPAPNGNVWLALNSDNGSIWLDLYDPQGNRVKSGLRTAGSETTRRVLAARDEEIVLYGEDAVHFQAFRSHGFKEIAVVPRKLPAGKGQQGTVAALTARTAIPVLEDDSVLLIVNRSTADLLVFDAKTKKNSLVSLDHPRRIAAAASDAGRLYFLVENDSPGQNATVLRLARQGNVLTTFECPLTSSSQPLTLMAVRGKSLYLASANGRGERFLIP